ncbi:MAG: hypothetical protein ACYDHW_09550 [Syntrophorhabdaceae bacterium]
MFKNRLLAGASLFIAVILLFFTYVRAGDETKHIEVENPEVKTQDLKKSVVRNPHGFLEYDGTGYRVITRDAKPEKASQVRLKPVTSKEHGTMYILEVIDENSKQPDPEKAADSSPRLAVQKVEDLDKRKGVAPEPKRDHKADVGVGVKVSESSEVLLGRAVILERREDKGLDSRDDGWRFRFKTNF